MRLDKTYAWDDVTGGLVTALGGLLAILLLTLTPWDHRAALLLGLAPVMAYFFRFSTQRRRDRADRPSLWLEEKVTLQALAIVLPLVIAWLVWSRVTGTIDLPSAGAAAVFFVGVGLVYVGIADANWRKYLTGSLALIAYGCIMPSLAPREVALYGAAVLIVGGLGAAAIVAWQLRRDQTLPTGTEESR
jgi:hypothetical protein